MSYLGSLHIKCVHLTWPGDRVGWLRPHGQQVFHGNGSDPPGWSRSVVIGGWLVQALPHLLSGGPQHRPSDTPTLPVLARERHQPLVHLDTSTSPSKYACVLYLYVCIFIQYTPPRPQKHEHIQPTRPGLERSSLLIQILRVGYKSGMTHLTHTPSQMDMGVTSNMRLYGRPESVMASYMQIHCLQVNQ